MCLHVAYLCFLYCTWELFLFLNDCWDFFFPIRVILVVCAHRRGIVADYETAYNEKALRKKHLRRQTTIFIRFIYLFFLFCWITAKISNAIETRLFAGLGKIDSVWNHLYDKFAPPQRRFDGNSRTNVSTTDFTGPLHAARKWTARATRIPDNHPVVV